MPVTHKPRLLELELQQLHPSSYQMRRVFDPDSLNELADSIRSTGLLQPIVVRASSDQQYEIVAGERRWRACKLAGLKTAACLLNAYSDAQVAAAATIENVNRVNLNPIEEAQAYKRLVDEFKYRHEEVASIVGKSRSKITNCLRLLQLDVIVQQWIIQQKLSEGHAKCLVGLSASEQRNWARQCITQQWSVRQLELQLADIRQQANAQSNPNIQRLSEKLSIHLGCKVNIRHNSKQTKLEIDCHNLDVLDGVLDKINFTDD